MRVLKGPNVPPDDSTLVQHNITDGAVLSIVIEPDKMINIEVQTGPESFTHEVNHSMSVRQLKQLLIDNEEIAFSHKDFELENLVSDNIHLSRKMDDESLPLHYYGVKNGQKLQVVKTFIILEIVPEGRDKEPWYKRTSKMTTVCELKKLIMKLICDKYVTNISLFISHDGKNYKKLDENDCTPIGEICSSSNTLYLLEEGFVQKSWSVNYGKQCIGNIYGKSDPSDLSLKLRAQDQLGIPASKIQIYNRSQKPRRTSGYFIINIIQKDTEQIQYNNFVPFVNYISHYRSEDKFYGRPSGDRYPSEDEFDGYWD